MLLKQSLMLTSEVKKEWREKLPGMIKSCVAGQDQDFLTILTLLSTLLDENDALVEALALTYEVNSWLMPGLAHIEVPSVRKVNDVYFKVEELLEKYPDVRVKIGKNTGGEGGEDA